MTKTILSLLCLLAVAVSAGTASAGPPASESTSDTLTNVRADLDAITDELRNYPDSQASLRLRKIVDRARARIDKAVADSKAAPTQQPVAGAAPATGAATTTGAAKPQMAADEFGRFLKALKSHELDSARLALVSNVIEGGNHFTAAQIAQVLHRFEGSDMRVEIAVRMYPICSDTGAFGVVYEKLDNETSRQQLRSRLEGKETEDRFERTKKVRK